VREINVLFGYNFNFFKKSLENIDKDVIVALNDFHRYDHWHRGCNATFITLIPKIQNPQNLRKYRPSF